MTKAMQNAAFRNMYAPEKLTLGVSMSIEAFDGDEKARQKQERIAKLADEAGFAALWFQDVTLRDPAFGDLGTKYDSFVYLTYMMGLTKRIGLATASTVLTHRHPLRLAKEVNTLDQLSGGRFVMGISSGDRLIDFEGFGVNYEERGERFREVYEFYRRLTTRPYLSISSSLGQVPEGSLVPQALQYVPNIVVGQAQQTLEWIAEHGDGWMNYARPLYMQEHWVKEFRSRVETYAPGTFKPFSQPLFVNLLEDPKAPPVYKQAGFSSGRGFLLEYLEGLRKAGVNHVAISARQEEKERPVEEMLQEIAEEVLPSFPCHETRNLE